ncbi:MAG TPA: hypothetical protein PLI13_03965 [Paracoccus sp. (in: a-proteobacteria)]|nr:hypothetical protein [Paracoccus sp. (in: a-proteobacteria)]
MNARAALAAILLIAGCAAPTGQGPGATTAPASASASPSAADFAAARPGLRRIGYRNCDGFAMELFAPARMTMASVPGQALFLRAYAYRGAGEIRTQLQSHPARLERQAGGQWQDLPVTAAAPGPVSGGNLAQVPLLQQLGQAGPLPPGHYRLWLGTFMASRGAATCSMAPVWQFDLD